MVVVIPEDTSTSTMEMVEKIFNTFRENNICQDATIDKSGIKAETKFQYWQSAAEHIIKVSKIDAINNQLVFCVNRRPNLVSEIHLTLDELPTFIKSGMTYDGLIRENLDTSNRIHKKITDLETKLMKKIATLEDKLKWLEDNLMTH